MTIESKRIALTVFSFLAVFLFVGLISADMTFAPTSLSGTGNDGSTVSIDVTITNSDAVNAITAITSTMPSLVSGSNSIPSTNLSMGAIADIAASGTSAQTLTINIPASQAAGTYTGNITLDATKAAGAVQYTLGISLTVADTFCSAGTIDDTNLILKVDISNTGEGEDEEWLPLDVIEVEVELENDGVDLNDVTFEIGLYEDGSSLNIIDEMIWISEDDEEYEFGDIDEDDDGAHVFEFKVDQNEVNSGNYILMAKAYPNGDESETCIDHSSDLAETEFGTASEFYAEINVDKETDRDKMVVIELEAEDNFEAACEEQAVLTVDVWNIGNRDYEDQIMVSLFNSDLGLDMQEVILGDLDEGDNEEVSFVFNVPSDAEEKLHSLRMRTYYDYDESDGSYETDYDRRSEDTFISTLSVSGNCAVETITPTVSVNLESEAKAGEELTVRVTIINPSDSEVVYTLSAAGYANWANTATLNANTITLGPNGAADVLVTFDVMKSANGEQLFNIELLSDGQFVASQPVQVYVEESKGFGFLTGNTISENSTAYALGLLNVILILVIIIVAVRVSRN
jgi:uncharacterized membrane protein